MTPPSPRYRRASDVVSRSIGQETVLLDLRSGRYFGLNATGAVIWDLMEDSGTPAELLIDAVVQRFEVERSRAEADVRELLSSLERENLVSREN